MNVSLRPGRRAPLARPLSLATLSVLASCAATGGGARFTAEGREVAYEAGGVPLTGYLALPVGAPEPRPGVLVVHEWWGHNEYVRRRARELAELGYVAFALDMYGTGKLASHPRDATTFMQTVMNDAPLMEARFRAALDVLHGAPGVDPTRTAAIGYCMGGGIVLRMARTTETLDVAASFHGSLGAALGLPDVGHTRYVFLANGADDPFVPQETSDALAEELRAAPGMREVVVESYPGAVHAFTNPDATAKGAEFDLPLRYDAQADAASWNTLRSVLRRAFD